MDWIELIVHTTTEGTDEVSSVLMDAGAAGTMIEDRADIPDPSVPHGIWEIIDPKLPESMPEDVLVHAWYEPEKSVRAVERIRSQLDSLSGNPAFYGTLFLETKDVSDDQWKDVWKKYYKPFHVSPRLVIKPTWESYDPAPGDRVIEMDPGMAFGSGTHETTSMCLALLEENLHEGESVIDLGCGSGILAIGAALLGASRVLAIDIDPDAVRVSAANVALNRVGNVVTVRQGNLLDHVEEVCDVCVANIISDVIIAVAASLSAHIRPGGLFICSGIVSSRAGEVEHALLQAPYQILQRREKGDWTAFVCRRNA